MTSQAHDKKKERPQPLFISGSKLLLDLGALAHAATQIVQLGPADLTVADDLNGIDRGRVHREHLLHAHAVGDTADGDGLLNAAVLLSNDSTLENLDTLAGALLDFHVDTYSVADFDGGYFAGQGFFVQFLNEIHGLTPPKI